MILFCHGTDSFRVYQKLAEIKQQFKSKVSQAELSLEDFDFEVSWDRLHQSLFTFGFLATKRLVILRDVLSKSKDKNLIEKILQNYDKISQSDKVTLVIVEIAKPKVDKKTKELFKKLSTERFNYELNALSTSEINGWIVSEIKRRGGQIEMSAVSKIVSELKNDLWAINSLLDILIAYKNGDRIEIKDLDKFLTHHVDDNIFNLVDALINEQERKTLELLNGQLNSGVSEHYLLTMIERQILILAKLRQEIDQGGFIQSRDLAQKLKLHPFVVQKGLAQARNYPLSKIKRMYQKIVDLDIELKNGGDASVLLSLLAIKK